jgi:hypothetical protein
MKTRTGGNRGTWDHNQRKVGWIIFSAAVLLLPAVLSSGEPGRSRIIAGFSLGGLFPAGAFNDHVNQNGFGLGVFGGSRLGQAPVFIGFELSFNLYGYTHRHEYLEGIPEVRLDVDTSNNILQGLLFVRAQPRRGAVRPYVEGLAGISYLFTDTTISGHEFPWNEISSDTNYDDVTVTAGAGAGLSVRLSRRRGRDTGRRRKETLLDIKVRYMAGGRAKYLKQGSIVVEGNDFTYTVDQSTTSFVTAQVAFSWFF